MRLQDFLQHPKAHTALADVGIDDHHDQPENIEAENTTLSVSPLPGGPGVWDIAVPYNASVVMFSFQSRHTVELSGARAGATGIATRSMLQASTVSLGGPTTIAQTSKVAFYSKVAAALSLSHKVFSSGGLYIALTEIWLYETVPGVTRVLRTYWTNYGASYYTLDARGQVSVIG